MLIGRMVGRPFPCFLSHGWHLDGCKGGSWRLHGGAGRVEKEKHGILELGEGHRADGEQCNVPQKIATVPKRISTKYRYGARMSL